MNPTNTLTYTVPTNLAGQSLNQLGMNNQFRGDVVAGWGSGINPNTPLTAGQQLTLNIPENYSNSGETQGLSKLFGQGLSPSQIAQNQYQAGIGSAVSTMNAAGTSLQQQYQDLLGSISAAGSAAINTTTGAVGADLARRGITNNSLLYGQILGSAQLPISTAIGSAEASAGYTEGQLQTNLAQNIAGIQAGGAGTSAGLPLSYGSLALAHAANIANIALAGSQAAAYGEQANYVPIPGVGLWDIAKNAFVGSITNNNLSSGGFQITNVGGHTNPTGYTAPVTPTNTNTNTGIALPASVGGGIIQPDTNITPPGYHWDNNGNLVPNTSTPPANTSTSLNYINQNNGGGLTGIPSYQ